MTPASGINRRALAVPEMAGRSTATVQSAAVSVPRQPMKIARGVEELGKTHAGGLRYGLVLSWPKGVSVAMECAPSLARSSAPAAKALDYQRAEPAMVLDIIRISALLAMLARIDASPASAATVNRPQPSFQNLHEVHGLLRYHA